MKVLVGWVVQDHNDASFIDLIPNWDAHCPRIATRANSVALVVGLWWAWLDLNLGPHPDPKIDGERAGWQCLG
jgi:hypothetical protein